MVRSRERGGVEVMMSSEPNERCSWVPRQRRCPNMLIYMYIYIFIQT